MAGWMDDASLRSYQQYFGHIRSIGGTESPDRNNEIVQILSVCSFDCSFPVVLSKEQPILSFFKYFMIDCE